MTPMASQLKRIELAFDLPFAFFGAASTSPGATRSEPCVRPGEKTEEVVEGGVPRRSNEPRRN